MKTFPEGATRRDIQSSAKRERWCDRCRRDQHHLHTTERRVPHFGGVPCECPQCKGTILCFKEI